ncbi:hypothetical protein H696_05966 [Fonticula alba]|uniref:Major facilitator superfamily (MFS) profile domain-containing protein n=1 Tax=Fonticula alba TaxID=691883 RepID=A0A058Z0Y0_FONAL|nr:hypothetical protein H696_05966 [Fonticula alba]KCV67568.1 hypothetical protein H696_05966 [Fonticula alba]|eukprot:XP_009498009.1 hypothetical protein H696_05966 [Fonticula alba]
MGWEGGGRGCGPSPDVEALTDPSVEDPNVVFRGLDPSAQENLIRTEGPNGTLESPSQRRSRTRSLYVAMAILFFGAMMASVTVPSLYLFLESMKPGPTMTPSSGTDSHLELGIVSAMFPLGQLLGLPVTNYWYVRKNARQVFITMGIFSIIFSMGYLFALNRFAILLSRFSLGFCLSGTLITLPYIAHSTPVVGSGSSGSERFYFISISTTLLETGFALGPVFGVLMMNVSFYVGVFWGSLPFLFFLFAAPGLGLVLC